MCFKMEEEFDPKGENNGQVAQTTELQELDADDRDVEDEPQEESPSVGSNENGLDLKLEKQKSNTKFDEINFSLEHTFRVESEDRDPWIRHIEVMEDGNILLADRYNSQLLLYDCNGIKQKQTKLASGPWSMTLTNSNTVAITLPDIKTVMFVYTNNLKAGNKINVHDNCRGIACVSNKLFVNCVTNGLKLLAMNGRTIKVFPQYVGYMSLVKGPDQRVLGALFAEDRIVCLDIKGKFRYEYKEKSLSGPTSFAYDNGNQYLYIVGHQGSNIHLLGDKGKKNRVLLNKKDGMDRPWAIAYDPCVKKLFISNFGGKNISVLKRKEEQPEIEFKSLKQKTVSTETEI